MSTENIGHVASREAGEAMTDKQNYIVQLDAAGKIEVGEGATDLLCGVLQNTPDVGQMATYAFSGIAKVKFGGTVTPGAWVTSDTSGKAIATTTDKNVVIGRYIGTSNAVDGDIGPVQLGIFTLSA